MKKQPKSCKKIGILGGTFNPVHMGHLFMAEYARETVGLDMVFFIPTGMSYMKNTKEILSKDFRREMLELSIQDNDYFVFSDIELNREGNTYTYETLALLQEKYPQAQFYFLTGADCLFSIERWYQPQKIFDNCILVAANRNHVDKTSMELKKAELEEKFNARIILIDFPSMDISSTQIRKNLKEEKSIRYMVPDAVFQYIHNNQLYKEI